MKAPTPPRRTPPGHSLIAVTDSTALIYLSYRASTRGIRPCNASSEAVVPCIKAAPAAPLARRQRRPPALREAPADARRAIAAAMQIKVAHVAQSGEQAAVFLGVLVSSSRSPRQGRPYGPSPKRSAAPTLDPAPTHTGSAPVEGDGGRAGLGRGGAA